MAIKSRRVRVTTDEATLAMKKIDARLDWHPMNAGLTPIMAPQNDMTVRVDFSGQGNETEGLIQAGFSVPVGTNHDPWAIVAHQRNHPETEATCTDLTMAPYDSFPHTDIYVATPSCIAHTGARGKKEPGLQQEFWGEIPDVASERDRLLMEEVVRNASDELLLRGRPFSYIVVENVKEVANGKWPLFPRWVTEMQNLGYHVQILNLNGRFAHGRDFIAPGQDRNRIYILCTYRGNGLRGRMPVPDLDKIRPPAWCANEGRPTNARQVWKDVPSLKGLPPHLKVGTYGQQYIYCCEGCGKQVEPLSLAAQDHIDFDEPMVKIKDRADRGLPELKPPTIERLKMGWVKIVLPAMAEAEASKALASVAEQTFSFTTESAARTKRPRGMEENMPALTERHVDAVAHPGGLTASQSPTNAGGFHRLVSRLPLSFLMRNNRERRSSGEMSTSTAESARTITEAGHQTVVRPPGDISLISPYNGNSTARPMDRPSPALVTVDPFMLMRVRAETAARVRAIRSKYNFTIKDVPEGPFMETETRMITPDEGGSLQGENLGRDVGGSKRTQMSLHGRAVVVQALRLIGEEIMFTLNPELRPDDRMPDLDRIMAAQREPALQEMETREHIILPDFAGSRATVPNTAGAVLLEPPANEKTTTLGGGLW